MKILWLYYYCKDFTTNHWLNIDFARAISKYPDVELKVYGLHAEIGYPDISLCAYNKNITLDKLHSLFAFDVVIINTKSRMFKEYLPVLYPFNKTKKSIEIDCWLPSDFKSFKCPKVVIEEDYHYEINDDWYAQLGIDLLLQRHYSQARRVGKIPSIWFPFSVDTDVFKPSDSISYLDRKNKICFMGSDNEAYLYRNTVRKMLHNTSMLDDFGHSKTESDYITNLQQYAVQVCCSSIYNITPAKMFEIMACGSVLWTNNSTNYGLQELFPRDSYFTYNENFSGICVTARSILFDIDLRYEVTKNAMNCIHQKHTHNTRIQELLTIIRKYF